MDTVTAHTKLDNNRLAIFFLQLGSHISFFFEHVLQQAAYSNGAQNVYVLTDTNFELYKNYNCIDVTQYARAPRPFNELYKHHSANTYFFEKTCFDRWFIMLEVAKDLNIANFVHADCDVLILQDLKPVYNNFIRNKYEGSMMFFASGDNSITSAHTSFWNLQLLSDFCTFINDKYADKAAFNKLLDDTLAGKYYNNTNVSDMILLDAFRTETMPNTINLLSLEEQNMLFDFNINVTYNGWNNSYVMRNSKHIKKVTTKSSVLYGEVAGAAKGQSVKFYTMHFQGYLTKALIPIYATPANFTNGIRYKLQSAIAYYVRKGKLFKNHLKAKLTG